MDSVVSPQTAITLGQLGGLGVLDLEGRGPVTRTPSRCSPRSPARRRRGTVPHAGAVLRADQARAHARRLAEIRAAGVTVAGALTPQRTQELYETVVDAGVDLFVIRGTTVSAEHVSPSTEPLNLKKFIYDLDVPVIVGGAATYTAALHLMRTGAAGVLVGFGGGAASTTRATLGIHAPMATAVADVAGARRDYLDESGGRYVHVIADGGVGTSGDIVKALAMGADAVMLGVALARATERPGAVSTGAPRPTTPSFRAAAASRSAASRRSRRSSTARRPSPTARRTSSGRCASRWRPPDTPTSRSSSGSRSCVAPYEADDAVVPSTTPHSSTRSARGFPPTLREVMLRGRWIGMLLLCLVVAGRVRVARAVAARARDRHRSAARGCDRAGAAAHRRRRAGRVPPRAAGRTAGRDRRDAGSPTTSSSCVERSTTTSRATGSPASCGSRTDGADLDRGRDRMGSRPR